MSLSSGGRGGEGGKRGGGSEHSPLHFLRRGEGPLPESIAPVSLSSGGEEVSIHPSTFLRRGKGHCQNQLHL